MMLSTAPCEILEAVSRFKKLTLKTFDLHARSIGFSLSEIALDLEVVRSIFV